MPPPHVTREALLALPWATPGMRDKLTAALERPGVLAVTASRTADGRLSARAWPATDGLPRPWPPEVIAVVLTAAGEAAHRPPARRARRPQEALQGADPALPPAPASDALLGAAAADARERPRADANARERTLADAAPQPAGATSRTAQALALLDGGLTMTEASRRAGIGLATLSHAVKRRAQPRCPCCGQTLRPGAYPRPPAG